MFRRCTHALLLTLVLAPSAGAQAPPDAALVAKARAIHDRVIALDTHNDINPRDFTPERNYTQRLDTQVNIPKMVEGGLDASFFIVYVGQGPMTPEGYDRALQAGRREVRRRASADGADRAGQDRARADGGRRAAHRGVGTQGGAHRRGERVSDRHRHLAREGVLRSRRALHVARAQRQQPVRRLEHERARRHAAQGPQPARPPGDRRDEPVGHHGGPLASVEGGEHAGHRALEGARHRVALGGARAGRSSAATSTTNSSPRSGATAASCRRWPSTAT